MVMNRPETIVEIAILTMAVIVVAADVFARMIAFPNQRGKFVRQLLDWLI